MSDKCLNKYMHTKQVLWGVSRYWTGGWPSAQGIIWLYAFHIGNVYDKCLDQCLDEKWVSQCCHMSDEFLNRCSVWCRCLGRFVDVKQVSGWVSACQVSLDRCAYIHHNSVWMGIQRSSECLGKSSDVWASGHRLDARLSFIKFYCMYTYLRYKYHYPLNCLPKCQLNC